MSPRKSCFPNTFHKSAKCDHFCNFFFLGGGGGVFILLYFFFFFFFIFMIFQVLNMKVSYDILTSEKVF